MKRNHLLFMILKIRTWVTKKTSVLFKTQMLNVYSTGAWPSLHVSSGQDIDLHSRSGTAPGLSFRMFNPRLLEE